MKQLKLFCLCKLVFAFVMLVPIRLSAQLVAGDIAVLGFNSDQSSFLDGDAYQDAKWGIVVLKSLSVGTVVHFTDAGIKEDGTFFSNPNNEGHLTWTITSTVPAGKIFIMDCVDGSNFADLNGAVAGTGGLSDYGTVTGHLGGTTTGAGVPFGTTGDQIIVYQGTAGATSGATFIYALNTQQNGILTGNGVWQTSSTVTTQGQSFLPPGLSNGLTAVTLTTNVSGASSGTGLLGSPNYGFDNMFYAGTTSGTKSQLLSAIANPSNWVGDNANPFNAGVGAGFTYASDFTVSEVLPLQWGDFTLASKDERVILKWSTLQELNTAYFEIQYAIDGKNFIPIGKINASGKSTVQKFYSFEHVPTAESAKIYYRIKQWDLDGQFSFSTTQVVNYQPFSGFKILNNPIINDRLEFLISHMPKIGNFWIFDTTGNVVSKGSMKTSLRQEVSVSRLPSGIYTLLVTIDGERMAARFIKKS